MLRSFLIYLSKAGWARRFVMGWGLARRTALRFVAGETVEAAIAVTRELNANGMNVTLDQLGEDTSTPAEARAAAGDIIALLDRIAETGMRANVSLKLTQLGLNLDKDLCAENLARILKRAQSLDTFVRIDMEDSPVLDDTLAVYHSMRGQGFNNVGLVLQSYLYRTEQDARDLMASNTRIRLVKGAYDEPPQVAYPKKSDVNACFDRVTVILLKAAAADSAPAVSADGKWPPIPAIATHDGKRIVYAKAQAEKSGLPKNKLEFQMLYGIRRKLQEELAAEGYPVRIYVPYGTQWYPYFMRRLAERPANLWFFLSSLLRG